VSKEQKEEFEQRKKEKLEEAKRQSEELEKQREKNAQRSEEAFDAFLKGEKPKQGIDDDMTLQDIFKQYYKKAKTIDVKGTKVVNSALSSLNGFSSKLEKRR
jgi:hypothetical protein